MVIAVPQYENRDIISTKHVLNAGVRSRYYQTLPVINQLLNILSKNKNTKLNLISKLLKNIAIAEIDEKDTITQEGLFLSQEIILSAAINLKEYRIKKSLTIIKLLAQIDKAIPKELREFMEKILILLENLSSEKKYLLNIQVLIMLVIFLIV